MSTHTHRVPNARRLFRCARCDHRLRIGTAHCGACDMGTPIYNRRSFYLLMLLLVASLVVILVVFSP